MQLNLSIKSDKSPGVLARVIVALRRFKLNLTDQQMIEQEDHRLLSVTAEGPNVDLETLLSAINDVKGVMLAATGDAAATPATIAATANPTKTVSEDFSSIAARLIGSYPDIGDMVGEYRDLLEDDQAAELMFALGIEVAGLRMSALANDKTYDSLDTFIAELLIPDMQGLAKTEFDQEGLKVMSSVFTKSKKGKKTSGFSFSLGALDDADKCDFLSGYMQGVLENTKGMEYVHVGETFCRNEGHPYCLFEFDQN
ncbi:MAG: hypothetical protein AAF197_06290 [Pseudomonadota bacterium]